MLDTDMCICLINRRDDALRERFERHAGQLCISSITYAELCFGVSHSQHVAENTRELAAFCVDLDIRSFDAAAGLHHGEIRHELSRRGRPIGANDLLIAGHARSLGATLVTNNRTEFGRVSELQMENWLT